MWVGRLPKKEAEERAMTQLKRVRIAEQAQKFPLRSPAASSSGWRSPGAVPDAEDHAVRRATSARPGDDQEVLT